VNSRTIRFAILAGLAGLTTLAFWPLRTADFIHLDDTLYVTRNPPVLAGLTGESLRWAWTCFHAGFWAPVLWMSYMVDVTLFGLNPAAFHAVNILWHTANALLLFLVFHQTTGAVWRSALAAAVFAVHPLRVESVAWIAERKDVLSLFFGLAALWAYGRYVRRPSAGIYALLMVSFTLGLMVKSMLVTLPCVLLLLDYWPLGRWRRGSAWPLIREKLPLFALSGLFCALTFLAHRDFGGVQTVSSLSLPARCAHAVVAYGWYLVKMVWPADLALFYPHPQQPFAPLTVLGAGAVLLGISFAVFRLASGRPYLATGWAWYLGTLVPVIGLVQVGMQAWADRFTYLPMIGVVWGGVWLAAERAERWRVRPPVRAALAGVLLAALCLLTRGQAAAWQNTETVARHALRATGDNFIAETLIGNALEDRGEDEKAVEQYRRAIRANPDYFVPYSRLGVLLDRQGRMDEAIKQYVRALELNPSLTGAQLLLGRALQRRGQLDLALELYLNVIRNDPADPHAHYAAGTVYEAREAFARALSHYTEAARLEPKYASARDRLVRRTKQGE
jgi:Flp pilus assembly protein TadD